MARILKPVAKPKAMISNHTRCHRVSPADVINRHAEGRRQSVTFVGTWSPSADGNCFDPLAFQLRPFCDFFDRQSGFLKQQINGADRQDDLLSRRPES